MSEEYKYTMVKTKFVYPMEKGVALKDSPLQLDLPFTPYHKTIYKLGKDITYSPELWVENDEVVALVAYMNEDHPSGKIKNEKAVAEAFSGKLGSVWDDLKNNADVKKHIKITQEDKLAVYDENKKEEIKYKGADKLEVARFAEWDEGVVKVVEEKEEIIVKKKGAVDEKIVIK